MRGSLLDNQERLEDTRKAQNSMDDAQKKQAQLKKMADDSQVVSRDQYNEDKNVAHEPESEDSIALKSPSVQGSDAVSGSTPDPESDDDTLLNAHAMGLQLDEDIEHPKPLDLAGDINKAEKYHRDN